MVIRGLAWKKSLWPCEYALVRETPKTAADVALFSRLLTSMLSAWRVMHILTWRFLSRGILYIPGITELLY